MSAAPRTPKAESAKRTPSRGTLLGCLALLSGGLLLTAYVSWTLYETRRAEVSASFERLSDRAMQVVRERARRLEYGLRGARGIRIVSPNVSRGEWRAYMMSRDLEREFPGALGFGYAERVRGRDLPEYLARMRSELGPDFQRKVVEAEPGGGEHVIVQLIEPIESNKPAVGVDILSEASRRDATVLAMRTGEATLTAPIDLVQVDGSHRGLLYLLPVFRPDLPSATEADRIAACVGFVYAPIIMERAMEGLAERVENLVDIEIFDGGLTARAHLLYDADRHLDSAGPTFTDEDYADRLWSSHKTLNIGGRTWDVRVTSAPEFEAQHRTLPVVWITAMVGITLTTSLMGLVWALSTGRARARALAERRTRELQAEKAYLAAVQDCSPLAMFVTDMEGQCTYLNPRYEELTGQAAKEGLGVGWVRALHPDDVRRVRRDFEQAKKEGHLLSGEYRWVRPDASVVWTAVRAARIEADEQPLGFVGTIEDVTGARQATEALKSQALHLEEARDSLDRVNRELSARNRELDAARAVAEAATKAKSQFLANMSHELRTPMTSILGFAQLLADRRTRPEDLAEYVSAILRNGDHMLSLINDVLDLSKIEAGMMTVESIPVSVTEVVNEVAAFMRPRATEKGLGFVVDWRTDVPDRMRTDPTRLRQILLNLVGNAVKFTDQGSVAIQIERRKLKDGTSRIEFAVVDTGPGIDPGQLSKIFQPFTQADDSTTRKFGGTGLGLSISKELARLLGGDLYAVGAPGIGSTFVLELPVVQGPSGTWIRPAERQPAALMACTTPTLHGKVLVVDDGIDNQRLISLLLGRTGASVDAAGDGREGVNKALWARESGEPYDLIIMDMQMPKLDGLEATRQLRAAGLATPIVALTANALIDDRERCKAAGCNAFLQKPIDRIRFFATCQQLMALGRAG
ncbi:MAG: CHASE domain-containing protein [Myxococcales bacterium]|nr:CHASE domain-containing protein [Myxococcales bacterium]